MAAWSAGAVDPAGHPVQQHRHLNDLAVAPPHQERRLAIAGALVRAKQPGPHGQPGHLNRPGRIRRGRVGTVRRGMRVLRPPSRAYSSLAYTRGPPGGNQGAPLWCCYASPLGNAQQWCEPGGLQGTVAAVN